jgi:PadR family transcriptional regulator PadR
MVTTERVLTSLRKGLVEFCVLAILRDGSTYGLEMARRLESDGLIAGESTLYPLLARLLANGLAESQWSESEAGRPRKYYTLTAEGREALDIFEQSWVPLRNAVDRTLRRPS